MFLILREFFPGLTGRKNKRILHTAHVKYIHPFSTEKALDLDKLQYELYRNGKCWKNDQFWGSFWVCFPHPCESSWEYQKGSQFQRHLMQKKSTAMELLKTARSAPTSDSLQIIIFSHFTRISRSSLPLLYSSLAETPKITLGLTFRGSTHGLAANH